MSAFSSLPQIRANNVPRSAIDGSVARQANPGWLPARAHPLVRHHVLGAAEMQAIDRARTNYHLLLQALNVMKIARISAICHEGGVPQVGRTALVTCGVDGNDQIIAGDWPGLIVDHGVQEPFLFRMSEHAEIAYGAGGPSESTSLGRTPVRTGGRFRIGSRANYEVEGYYVHTEESGDAASSATRMARMTAACVDSRRDGDGLTLFCVVDEAGRVSYGDWLGYESNGEERMPFVLCNRLQAVFAYRSNVAQCTTLRGCRVGNRFHVSSLPDGSEVRRFEVVNCELL